MRPPTEKRVPAPAGFVGLRCAASFILSFIFLDEFTQMLEKIVERIKFFFLFPPLLCCPLRAHEEAGKARALGNGV